MRTLLTAVWLASLAALAMPIVVIVGIAGASLHWTFDLAAQFLLPATVVAAAVTLVALVFRWWRFAGAAAGVTAIAYLIAMPWTSAPAAVPADALRFKVLLFNVWYGNGRFGDVRRMVEETGADIAVFVETTPRVRRHLQPLEQIYPYRFDCIGTENCDIAIFARSRLTSPAVKSTSDSEGSPLVTVETEIAGCRMMLFATHMTRPFPNRPYGAQREQAREIGSDVGAFMGAKLVLGDFNAAPWGYVMRTIASRGKVSILTGAGGTWHSRLPPQMRIPIDNMLASEGLSFVSRQVLPQAGSDHLPVLAEIAVTDRSKCR